jgi:hypothetical protein
MHNEEHGSIFGQSCGGTSLFSLIGCVFKPDKWIKKHLASFFKSYAMFVKVAGRLFRIPNKMLTTVKEEEVHRPTYIHCMASVRSGKVNRSRHFRGRIVRHADRITGLDGTRGRWRRRQL